MTYQRIFKLSIVSILLVVSCFSPKLSSGQLISKKPKSDNLTILSTKMVPDGFGVQLKNHSHSREDLNRIKDLGLTWVRHGFIWKAVEKQQGVYDFGLYDDVVKDCRKLGLKMVGCIAFGNEAVYGVHAKDEPARSAYARFAAEVVARYKEYDIVWEIWNEPNTMTFWGKHGGVGNSEQYASEYLDLVKTAVPAMKKANPDCIILGGSVSNMWSKSYQWMNFAFQKGLLKSGINILSVHPYGLKSPEDYIEAYDTTRVMMANAGGPILPLFNSERGFPLKNLEGFAGGDAKMQLEYQAWHTVRQYLIDMYLNVIGTIWYEWTGIEKEKAFSLYDKETTLPLYTATQVLIKQLKGFELEKRINIGAARDFVLRFKNASGEVKLVVWTAPPPTESPDKIVPHMVLLPVEENGIFQLSDIYGNVDNIKAKDNNIHIELSGAPKYIKIR